MGEKPSNIEAIQVAGDLITVTLLRTASGNFGTRTRAHAREAECPVSAGQEQASAHDKPD
jgi:hypothetical protein